MCCLFFSGLFSFTFPPSLFPFLLFPVLLSLSQRSRTLNHVPTEGGGSSQGLRDHEHRHIHILDVPIKHYLWKGPKRDTEHTDGSAHSEKGRGRNKEKGGRKSKREEGRKLKIDFSARGSVCSLTFKCSVFSKKKGKAQRGKHKNRMEKVLAEILFSNNICKKNMYKLKYSVMFLKWEGLNCPSSASES